MLGSESAWSSSLVLEVDVLNATLAILIMEDTVLNRVLNRVCEVRPHLIVLKLRLLCCGYNVASNWSTMHKVCSLGHLAQYFYLCLAAISELRLTDVELITSAST